MMMTNISTVPSFHFIIHGSNVRKFRILSFQTKAIAIDFKRTHKVVEKKKFFFYFNLLE